MMEGIKMKFLKLDAQFEGARKLAECLIGSLCNSLNDEEKADLLGLNLNRNSFMVRDAYERIFCHVTEIRLPLDTLKLCPFMAMKNHVNLKFEVFNGINNYILFGKVIGFEDGKILFDDGKSKHLFELNCFESPKNQFTLDFEKLPDGAEIID